MGVIVTTSVATEWKDSLMLENGSLMPDIYQQEPGSDRFSAPKPLLFNADSMLLHYAVGGYNSCIDEWKYYYMGIMPKLTIEEKQQLEDKTRKAAEQHKSDALMLEWVFLKAMHLPESNEAEITTKVNVFQTIVEKSGKQNDTNMKVRAMSEIFYKHMFIKPYNYAKGFMQASRLAEELENVTEEQCPEKRLVYYRIGEAYYFFRDYDKAKLYLTKALSSEPLYHLDWADVMARNILGVYYNSINQLDTSDYYFQTMLESASKVRSSAYWKLSATISVADNLLKKRQYDKALGIYRQCLDDAHNSNNFQEATITIVGMAECYFEKGDMPKSKELMDNARINLHQLREQGNPAYILWYRYYTLASGYHINTFNARQARLYQDSALTVKHEEDEHFNSMNILRAEQEMLEMQVDVKTQQILRQQRQLQIIISFFSVIAILLFVVVALYRKKQVAYRALVLRSEEWAQNTVIHSVPNTSKIPAEHTDETDNPKSNNGQPDAENKLLFETLQQLMVTEKLFLNPDITLDTLSNYMNVSRSSLSQTINRCTGKNFNNYVNEYRVKEVINMLSTTEYNNLTMDGLAKSVGFNSRSTFYESFKSVTGLTPTQFKRNKN